MRDPRVKAIAKRYNLRTDTVRRHRLHLISEDACMVMIGRMKLDRVRRETHAAPLKTSLQSLGMFDSRRA